MLKLPVLWNFVLLGIKQCKLNTIQKEKYYRDQESEVKAFLITIFLTGLGMILNLHGQAICLIPEVIICPGLTLLCRIYIFATFFRVSSQNSNSVAAGSVIVPLYTLTKSLASKPKKIKSSYQFTEQVQFHFYSNTCCSRVINHPALLLQTIVIILLNINVDN